MLLFVNAKLVTIDVVLKIPRRKKIARGIMDLVGG
jgi:hypothetical protein